MYGATNGYGYSTQPAGAPLAALPPSEFATAPQPTLTEITTDFAALPTPSAAAGAPQPFYGSTPTAAGTYGAPSPSFGSPPAAPFASPPAQYATPQSASYGAPAPAAPDAFAAPPPAPDAFAPPPATPVAPEPAPVAQEEAPAAAPGVDPAALTMKNLSGQDNPFDTKDASINGSLADQAYAKFANMGDFNLVSKKETPRANPFDTSASTSITGNVSLADMKAKKAVRTNTHEIVFESSGYIFRWFKYPPCLFSHRIPSFLSKNIRLPLLRLIL